MESKAPSRIDRLQDRVTRYAEDVLSGRILSCRTIILACERYQKDLANPDLYVDWARIKDAPDTQIAFVAPTDFDFDGHDNDDIIEQMKRLCVRFIKAFNDSGYFEQIEGKVPYKVLYDFFDQNVTGIVIEPKLKEEEGIIICEGEERTDDELEDDSQEQGG